MSSQFPEKDEVERIVEDAERILGYEFKDKSLLVRALTHPSAVEDERVARSYERMEFLGDAVLGAVVAEEIYHSFPQVDEGGMSRMKSAAVSGKSLSRIAEDLGYADVIIVGDSERGTGGRGMHSALENVFESIVAALMLDGGVDVARAWIEKTVISHIDEGLAEAPFNPKSRLQEILQRHHVAPEYRVAYEDGPSHARIFGVEAIGAGGEVLGRGEGRSKKEAEAAAARAAIEALAGKEGASV